jgi:decaprenyl-phosphate phosphoribosyltransferase
MSAAPGRPLLVALLAATRPRQWIKNLLVFAAPMAAGVLSRPVDMGRAGAAAVILLVASAGVYLINDVMDAPADRFHPVKRRRPVASGELPATVAATAGSAALTLALTASAVLAGSALAIVTAAYITISVTYSLWLKRQAVIDLACVSSGFVLRAVAGGVATGVAVSPWFILVTSAAALLVVAGKRTAEQGALSAAARSHRPVLAHYPAAFLLAVRIIAGSVAIISYALWAFGRSTDVGIHHSDEVAFQLSILPFVLGLLLVELTVEDGGGMAPEEMALSNRTLQVLGLVCVTLIAVGVYT